MPVHPRGPRPFKAGRFDYGLRAYQYLALDIHELTIEGIMQRDRDLLVRALSIDPLVNSIATARVVIDELFDREKDALLDWPEREAAPEPVLTNAPVTRAQLQLY